MRMRSLAIARFPLANDSSLLPAYWNFAVSIHLPTVWVLCLTVLLVYFVWRFVKHRALDKLFFRFPILISGDFVTSSVFGRI